MVQLEPNLSITLDSLASSGITIPYETKVTPCRISKPKIGNEPQTPIVFPAQQTALAHSLPIKKTEASLSTLSLWGQIQTLNGKDYLVCEGYNQPKLKSGKLSLDTKYYVSQDAIKWIDLAEADSEIAAHSKTLTGKLSGDPAHIYTVELPNGADPTESQEAIDENPDEPQKLVVQITELQRLRVIVDDIVAATSVVPKGCETVTADCDIVPNYTFAGMDYCDKLESYIHRQGGPTGPSLANDIRGTWSIQADPFKGIYTLRSLVWLGYVFSYNARSLTWGSLYIGDGNPNNDFVFMI